MSWLGFLIIAGVAAWLWRRVDTLERRLALLEAAPPALPEAQYQAPVAHDERPQAPAAPDAEFRASEPAQPPIGRNRKARAPRWTFDAEDLFGRLLPIWTGGVALAVAGFFLVRWSIDAGLLTPGVRVVLAALFGAGLLAGAELAYRWRERVADPRVAQALAGAGLATLYAAFYLAGATYGLIGSTLAFIGLASVTATAIALSSRFGLPSAILGLVGGFAAPALVGGDDANLPLLTIYLGLVTGGLALSGKRQNRTWLGVAALAAGLGWGGLLLAGAPEGDPNIAILGAYIVLLGTAIPALFGAQGSLPKWLRIGAAGMAALQLAALVQTGGFGALEWGLYLLLGAALAWYAWREPAMREAAAIAAAVGIVLLAIWPGPSPKGFAAVATILAALFAVVPLGRVHDGGDRRFTLVQVSAVALGLAAALYIQFAAFVPASSEPGIAAVLLALALLPAAGAWLALRSSERGGAPRLAVEQAAAALLGYAALAQVIPSNALAWTAAAAATATAFAVPTLRATLWTLAAIAAAWATQPVAEWLSAGVSALVGTAVGLDELPAARTVVLFLAPAVAAGAAWRLRAPPEGSGRRALDLAIVAMLVVALHAAFRHAFAAGAGTDFTATGVLQRATWEALLVAGAWLCFKRGWRAGATVLAATATAHFAWFSVGLHNPLWADQAVGATPVVNALVPAIAAGLASLILLKKFLPDRPRYLRVAIDAALMGTITLFALAELRQAFAGSLLTAIPVGADEDLLRSLLGILLALGFLLWGARTDARSWRIGSLVLMVIAVLKVFLIDTAGLEGLARIASFMALGFSLIGIGWFYSRQLRRSGKSVEPTVT